MAAAPVVMLANGITISRVAPHASRRVEGQWGGAGGTSIEEVHRLFARRMVANAIKVFPSVLQTLARFFAAPRAQSLLVARKDAL